MRILMRWLRLPAWQQILIALVAGIALGMVLGPKADYVKPVGSLFINAIHMIVAPVVFTAIVTAILSLKEKAHMHRITLRAFLLYGVCMMIAAAIGCFFAYWIGPGTGFHQTTWLAASEPVMIFHQISFSAFIENLLPSNLVGPFLQGNVLQLILFAVLFGIAIKLAGAAADPVAQFFFALNKVVYQITALVIAFAPYGIFALIAWVVGHFGLTVITPLLTLVGTVYLGCATLLLIVYPVGLWVLCRMYPLHFYRAIFPALAFSFTSSSSAATLPLTMDCAEKNLGLPPHITRFLLPLGTSFNLNGLSVYLSVATVFAANLYGIDLSVSQYFTIILTITLTAMGAAAVPGSALIVMGAVMNAVGIPLNAIAVIAGVDRLNDMIQTSTNVAGDVFVSAVVSKRSSKCNSKYNNKYK